MAGVHDYMCFEKRGFSRASMQASVDVCNGLMTRDEGLNMAMTIDKRAALCFGLLSKDLRTIRGRVFVTNTISKKHKL